MGYGSVWSTILLFGIILAIAAIAAWCLTIGLFIEVAKEKGYYKKEGAGILWFIGLFATPIVVGLYVTALPDKHSEERYLDRDDAANIYDELPSI